MMTVRDELGRDAAVPQDVPLGRYVLLPAHVFRDRRLSDSAKVLFAVMVDNSISAEAEISQPALMEQVGHGLATVRRAIAQLTEAGLVQKLPREPSATQRYRVVPAAGNLSAANN